MIDIKEKIAIKNKIADKMESDKPASITFYPKDGGIGGKEGGEVKMKDDWTIVLYVDWDEAWVVSEDSFLYFIKCYVEQCIDEDAKDNDDDEDESSLEDAVDTANETIDKKKKELAGMLVKRATSL